MQLDPVLSQILTPWGRKAPRSDSEMDDLIDHFAALKERAPADSRIDRVLIELGRILRQSAADECVASLAVH